jgi:hypothetical protein
VRAPQWRGVDLVQVHTNFEIGRRIVQEELRGKDRAAYGEEVMRALADRLTREFGRGFSHTKPKLMRLFYLQNQNRIGQAVTDQLDHPQFRTFTLSWTHYVFLLRIENPDERSFYEIEACEENWTVRELKRQFDSGLYERLALSRDKDGIRRLAREGHTVAHAKDLLNEPLVLEFLGVPATRIRRRRARSLFVVLGGEARHHAEILQCSHVAGHRIRCHNFAQQAAHDLAAASLGE